MTYREQVLADGAVAYWRLGELSGTTANSEVGSFPGTISGGVTLNQPGALADGNPAMAFDGATGKIRDGTITTGATFTVEGWVKGAAPSTNRPLFSNRESGTGGCIYCGTSSAANGAPFAYLTGPGQFIYGATAITDNAWHHLAFTHDGTTFRIYLDGVVTGSLACTQTPGSGVGSIGFDHGGEFASGSIDEVAIYPTALTPQQIADHYAARLLKLDAVVSVSGYTGVYDALPHGATGSATGVSGENLSSGLILRPYADRIIADGAVAYWRLGETSGTTARSEVGSYDGTISGGVTLNQPGALADGNPAMTFDGVNDFISVAGGAYLAIGTNAVTIEYWGRFTQATASWPINMRGDFPAAVAGVGFQTDGSNLYFMVADGTAFSYNTATGFVYADSQWHHIVGVVTRGATDRSLVYIDGVVRGDVVLASTGASLTNGGAAHIGCGNGGAAPFPGSLDDVAIYHTALTAQQIADHYALRTALSQAFTDVPGGTANWTFSAPNYNSQSGSVPIVITPAVATVVVTGYTGPYDGLPHGATGTATGIGGVDLSSQLDLGETFTNAPGGTAHWTFDG